MDCIECLLPGGYVDELGVLHREVELAPLSGHTEEWLAERWEADRATLVTAVLSRSVQRVGTIRPVSADLVRRLLVADRQYLLLKVRQVTFGDEVQATLLCPWEDCGRKVDIDFGLHEIPIRESHQKGPTYTMELSAEAAVRGEQGETYRSISFRLPDGTDQEIVGPLMATDAAAAFTTLLGRCIQRLGPWDSPAEALIKRLSPLSQQEIERQMGMEAPAVELTMEAQCPECGRQFSVPFGLEECLFAELRTSRDLLYREVHYLAYHYHWSEQEIMGMTRDKRRRYIAVLTDELERLSHAI